MCVPLHESPGTHMYNACHPLPAHNLACSDIGNEQQTAARSSVRTLRCWWHKNGQLKRKTKIQRADLERNFDEKHAAKVRINPIYSFMEVLSDLWFDCNVTIAPKVISRGVSLRWWLLYWHCYRTTPQRVAMLWATSNPKARLLWWLLHWWDWGQTDQSSLCFSWLMPTDETPADGLDSDNR